MSGNSLFFRHLEHRSTTNPFGHSNSRSMRRDPTELSRTFLPPIGAVAPGRAPVEPEGVFRRLSSNIMTNTEQIRDGLLVLRCQQGDGAAFADLVQCWQERLWRHANRLTGSQDASADIRIDLS